MPEKKPFTLYSRSLKSGKKVWYAKYRQPDGSWGSGQCTGESSKYRAESFCYDFLKSGGFVSKDKQTLSEFSKDFFKWDGSWAKDKKVRGLRLGERHCIELERTLQKLVLPSLGNLRLSEIGRPQIKEFRNGLFANGYAGATINHALSIVKILLEAAEENGVIRGIPKIDRAANNTKHKGILTVEEVKHLLSVEWDNYRAYTASLLAAATGLRLGEILGLVLSDYHPDKRYIFCRRSWDQALRKLNPSTKTGRARTVIISDAVVSAMNKLIELNPYPLSDESFIFFGDKSSAYPTEPKIITKGFFLAMKAIGISDEVRRCRNISFHSHRHFLNSLLINSNIPIQKVQSITGHLTNDMTQHYYHLDDMTDIQKVQEEITRIG